MENLHPPFIISIYGKPASGKSHLMKYILCRMRAEGKIDILFVFTSTKKNDFYDNKVDSERLLVQFWKKAKAISHRGKIYYLCLMTALAQSTHTQGQLAGLYIQAGNKVVMKSYT